VLTSGEKHGGLGRSQTRKCQNLFHVPLQKISSSSLESFKGFLFVPRIGKLTFDEQFMEQRDMSKKSHGQTSRISFKLLREQRD
jgi:hypothetical protein